MTNIQHLGESHDQYTTLSESCDESNIAHFSSPALKVATVLRFDLSHMRNIVTALCSYLLGRCLDRISSMHPTWLETRSGSIYLVSMHF